MSRGFFGVVSSTPTLSMDTTPLIYNQYQTSSNILVLFDKGKHDTYTYNWSITDNLVSINNKSLSSATFTNTGYIGKTTVSCTIIGDKTKVSITTDTIDIYWNSLNAIIFTAIWSIPNNITLEYDGSGKDVTVISTTPSDATYILSKKNAVNAGDIASSIIYGVIYYKGTISSPTITIVPKPISILPNGPVSLVWNKTTQTIPYLISGIVSEDIRYSVSGTTGSDCNNYTAILSTTSPNYKLNTYILNWNITPSIPANFTASVSADFTSITLNWEPVGGCIYNIYNNNILIGSSNTTQWTNTSLPDTTYNFHVVATCVSGTSSRTPIANILTGHKSYASTTSYDSGYKTLSPCCLAGTISGDIGLCNWVQGTNGIIITAVYVQNCVCNFNTTLLSGTASRNVKWNINNTLSNFPSSNSVTVSNPYPGPTTIPIASSDQTIGKTINYTLRAIGTGWSTNDVVCPSGIYWFSANWKNVGTITTTLPMVSSVITYIA